MNLVSIARKIQLLLALTLCLTQCQKGESENGSTDHTERSTRGKRSERHETIADSVSFNSEVRAASVLEDPVERNKALVSLARESLNAHPELAQTAILELDPKTEALPELIESYLTGIVSNNPSAALEWTRTIENQEISRISVELLAEMLSNEQVGYIASEMLDSARIAGAGFKPGEERIMQRWASQDPQAAATWLANVPGGEPQNRGIQIISSNLVQIGGESASVWLSSLSSENLRASAVEAMVDSLIEVPEPLREAILGSPDSELRKQLGGALARLKPLPEAELVEEPSMENPGSTEQN